MTVRTAAGVDTALRYPNVTVKSCGPLQQGCSLEVALMHLRADLQAASSSLREFDPDHATPAGSTADVLGLITARVDRMIETIDVGRG